MKRGRVDAILVSLCLLLVGVAVWLSATGCEWVALGVFAMILSAANVVIGCLLVGYRRFTSRPTIAITLWPVLSFAIIVSVATTQWPLRVSYAISRGAFDSFSQRVLAAEQLTTPQRVGMFIIRKSEISHNGIVCLWTVPDPGGNTGFVQCSSEHVPFNLWSIVRLDDRWQFISED